MEKIVLHHLREKKGQEGKGKSVKGTGGEGR